MVLARDDFEEQCNFVDVEVPDVECQEVEINNSPCPLFGVMGFSAAKNSQAIHPGASAGMPTRDKENRNRDLGRALNTLF